MATQTLSILRPVAKSKPRKVSTQKIAALTIPQQVQIAFQRGARIAAISGALAGGAIPTGVYVLVHSEIALAPWKWALVIGKGFVHIVPVPSGKDQAANNS